MVNPSRLPLPDFYDPAAVGELRLPRYDMIEAAADRAREAHGVAPAALDERTVAVFGIDCQVGFCFPDASLAVPGALDDMRRACEYILRRADRITSLIFSLDTHAAFQVFHPTFWVNEDGAHPPPMTPITARDVKAGRWVPVEGKMTVEQATTYCRSLEAQGRYVLTIWPYHTLLGAADHVLVPALFEAAHYHTLLRDTQAHFELKGRHPLTENYSVLEPEVKALGTTTVGIFNRPLFERLMEHDEVIVFGEASSHCVRATLRSMLETLQRESPDRIGDITVLADCMSPVPAPLGEDGEPLPGLDFPGLAEEALVGYAEAGMNVVEVGEV